MLLTEKESINADLEKCKNRMGYRSMDVIARDNNNKPIVVRIKQVKSLQTFMGC